MRSKRVPVRPPIQKAKLPTMQPVKSAFIGAVGHDPKTNVLHVEIGDWVYEFPDTSAEDHAAMMTAESIGGHFHRNIRSRPFTKRPKLKAA
jgi:KTSC domain